MKKLWLLCSVFALSLSSSAQTPLENYLSDRKNRLFDLQLESNALQGNMLRKSWIEPIVLSYQESTSTRSLGERRRSRIFSVGIDQPIFRSGGIYYAIRFAGAQEGANRKAIELRRRQTIVRAVGLLFDLRINRLRQKLLKLRLANDAIDIRRKEEEYRAGLSDSSFLDRAILQRNQDRSTLLDTRMREQELRNAFALISDRDPDTLRLPRLGLITLGEYRSGNLALQRKRLEVLQKSYHRKMTWAKYLPQLSLQASYTHSEPIGPGLRRDYRNYGFRITLPLSVNAPADIEAGRVEELRKKIELQDQLKELENDYRLVMKKLEILDKKIALDRSDEKLYGRLLRTTRDRKKAGKATGLDVRTMRNSLQMARINRRIHRLQRQRQLLGLYEQLSR